RKMLAARIVFPPKEFDDAEAVSRELGTCTVKQKNVSRPMWGGAGKSPTVSISEQPRRLLLPQEVKELGPTRMILFHEGLRPVLAQRVYYFRDRFFAKRERPPPEVPRLDIASATRQLRAASPPLSPHPANPGAPGAAQEVTAMPADPTRLDALDLEDFSLDFDDVEIPKGPMTDDEIKAAADSFISKLLD
ncbi:type IV secretory system conjugative DNA transfer family protein, partial [Variovorax saccharolyticus]|uniref:type IV secretory system conjugative DNA transfer family protein n=1 Tax=Variovorax saccharolyticus TaxID=3053516 RepID=UPI00257904C9